MGKLKKYLFLTCVIPLLCGCTGQEEIVLYQSETVVEAQTVALSDASIPEEPQTPSAVFVYVCGAVALPGVYEVAAGSRVYEVLNMAGGLLDTADAEYLNQAETVTDGQKLYVLTVEETETLMIDSPVYQESASETELTGLVNINTADVARLTTVTGIGTSRAESIIAYREEHGAFAKIEDVMNVTGIKDGLFGKIKDQITVGVK